jgi:hypothetical protein
MNKPVEIESAARLKELARVMNKFFFLKLHIKLKKNKFLKFLLPMLKKRPIKLYR